MVPFSQVDINILKKRKTVFGTLRAKREYLFGIQIDSNNKSVQTQHFCEN